MKELIAVKPSNVGSYEIKTVNARELHSFLESKKDFSTWIKDRIEKYGFVENQDFVIGSPIQGNQSGRGGDRRSIDYHLSIDMAKELSMVERNKKGKQARQYFIECEKIALAPQPTYTLPTNFKEALLQLVDQVEVNEQLQLTIAEQAPKVEALERIALTSGEMNITTTAKIIGIRPRELFQYLSTNRYIYRRVGGKEWVGYQHRVDQGLLTHKTVIVTREDGSEKVIERCLVTTKGIAHLAEKFSKIQSAITVGASASAN